MLGRDFRVCRRLLARFRHGRGTRSAAHLATKPLEIVH
jgi:hypothetical protein